MSRKTLFEQLLDYYNEGAPEPMPEDLVKYQEQLDYARDLLKRHERWKAWRMLNKKFGLKRSAAYNLMRDCQEFFTLQDDKTNNDFERILAIERLTALRNQTIKAANETSGLYAANCFKIAAQIERQIAELKGLYDKGKDIDPNTLIPGAILMVLPTGGRPKQLNLDADTPEQTTIDYIEGLNFSIDNMEREINKLDKHEESEPGDR